MVADRTGEKIILWQIIGFAITEGVEVLSNRRGDGEAFELDDLFRLDCCNDGFAGRQWKLDLKRFAGVVDHDDRARLPYGQVMLGDRLNQRHEVQFGVCILRIHR